MLSATVSWCSDFVLSSTAVVQCHIAELTPVASITLCRHRPAVSPTAPTHVILVPKNRDGLTQLQKAEERHKAILGHLLWAAGEIARKEGLQEGYRVVVNDGPKGCQSVYHLHLHIIGGKQLSWVSPRYLCPCASYLYHR